MPAVCNLCKTSVPCRCETEISHTSPCPVKKKAALWVVVRDEDGKGVEGVPIAISHDLPTNEVGDIYRLHETIESTTDSGGMFMQELDPDTVEVKVVAVPERLEKSHDLPQVSKKTVSVFEGTISYVFFDLVRKAILEVELVGTNLTAKIEDVVKDARVFLEEIVGTHFKDGRQSLATADPREEKPTGCVATFEGVSKGKYRVRVELAPDKQKHYLAQDVQFEMKAGELEKTVIVPVGELFKKVRFIGLCVAAVARQLWRGDDDLVAKYQITKQGHPKVVPDFAGRFETYEEDFQSYWSRFEDEQKDHWSVKYNGFASDSADISARIALLRSAIHQAKAGLENDSDTVLKVFVAPECFFLGRYGAYPHEQFGKLVRELNDLVSGAEWKCWVFVFGTVNGSYEADGRLEMFNMSPVIKGGSSGGPEGPGKFTKLLQKAMFSAEIATDRELVLHGDELRLPLTEEKVSAGFHSTQNEEIISRKVLQLLSDFRGPERVEHAEKAGLLLDEASGMCAKAEARIQKHGLIAFVRFLRGGEAEAKRKIEVTKSGDAWEPWMTSFKGVLKEYMKDQPDINIVMPEGARVMDPRDFSFSTLRVPGPWLDYVVEAGEEHPERKLTFAVEICADHLQGRFLTAAKQTSINVDIHLVPSAGAYLKPDSLGRVVNEGYAFNCDGWNCPSGSRVFERKGRVVLVEDELAPRQAGRNPLLPHTELWKAKSKGDKDKEMEEWKKEKEALQEEEERKMAKFKADKAEYTRLWDEWDRKNRQGPEPEQPLEPYRKQPPSPPVTFSYVTDGVKSIDLADGVDLILPYETAQRLDRWKAIEKKAQDTIIEQKNQEKEREKQQLAERLEQLGRDKAKEEGLFAKYNDGVKSGPLKSPSLKDLETEVAELEIAKSPKLGLRQKVLDKRRLDIDGSRMKLVGIEAELGQKTAELEKLTQPQSPNDAPQTDDTFTLPAMQKLAVPQLHIYPEQDLPVPA